ncbi:MAG: mechanosensitive ion channel family protein [Fimbriimonadaceae bacterium]|nr:mechanosensitive ion channel family protein [Fimbriimonadaceae bacterium]QYK56405.1 MAG: mechanosensitive ion channel family protein [Fimbriimonadaceae bacterium]
MEEIELTAPEKPGAYEYIEAGVVLGAGLVLGLILWRLVSWLLTRPGVKERNWARASRKPLASLLFWAVVIKALSLGASRLSFLQENPVYVVWITRLLSVTWLVVAVVAAIRFIEAMLRSEAGTGDTSHLHRRNLLKKLGVGGVAVFGALFGLRILGIDTAPLLAGGAIGGVIIGLALQESLANVFAGILFSLDGAVRVGDLVRFTDGTEGYVRSIGWRSTLIRRLDNSLLVVPNAQMSKEKLLNLNRPLPPIVVNLVVGVGYGSSLQEVEDLCVGIAREVQERHAQGEKLNDPFALWQEFDDSCINVKVFISVPSAERQYRAKSDLLKSIHQAFRENGIVIPYPTRTLDAPRLIEALDPETQPGAAASK